MNSNTSLATGTATGGGGINTTGTLVVTESTIQNNECHRDGGGIRVAGGTATLTSVTVASNRSYVHAGAIWNINSRVTVADSTIRDNVADSTGNNSGYAGGIHHEGVNAVTEVSRSTLSGNRGAVCAAIDAYQGNATLTEVTVSGNQATGNVGGGVCARGGGILTITRSTIKGNSTSAAGAGGIFAAGQVTLNDSTVGPNNTAKGAGGGIYVEAGTVFTSTNSTVSGNISTESTGGIHSQGTMRLRFTTVTGNQGAQRANLYTNNTPNAILYAVAVANPAGGGSNCGDSLPFTSYGFNRVSDASCAFSGGANDETNATIQFKPLTSNGGPTSTHLPVGDSLNRILDAIPKSTCEGFFSNEGLSLLDQRGLPRPRLGLRGGLQDPTEARCDVGAVELGIEKHFVCGPPLDPATFPDRCQEPTITAALTKALPNDIIVVSGVVMETVTVNKTITIRGPLPDEATPGTQMGIVQAAASAPVGNGSRGSVFTIQSGISVTIGALNIRYGDAVQGGGINNSGALRLVGVTLYDNKASGSGAGIHNSGELTVTDSTLSGNSMASGANGAGIHNVAPGTVNVSYSTLANTGMNLYNANTAAGSAQFTASILQGTNVNQCSGATSLGYNLVYNGNCPNVTPGAGTDKSGDPQLGPLKDNGGPTLTRGVPAGSPAALYGPLGPVCAVQYDQRGRARPAGSACDIGAFEYGPQRLTVCQDCDRDLLRLRFDDLQEALDRALAGDTIAIEAGVYTGNFVAYKDVTLEHAGIDTTLLNRDQPTDVRAILQASDDTIREQRARLDAQQVTGLSGSVLTTQSYDPTNTSIEPGSNVTVNMRGLTIQHGLARRGAGSTTSARSTSIPPRLPATPPPTSWTGAAASSPAREARGGGIYNAGTLNLERNTISGNQSEYYGGALYTRGQSSAAAAGANIRASTVAYNKADRLPLQHVVTVNDGPAFDPLALTVGSGDYVQFQSSGATWTLEVQGTGCNLNEIVVPPYGAGLSPDLVCTANEGNSTVTVKVKGYTTQNFTITVQPPGYSAAAHSLYVDEFSGITLANTVIVHRQGLAENCKLRGATASITSQGYNVSEDATCNLDADSDVRGDSVLPVEDWLGDLQDNNRIDFERRQVSGTTYSHALLPNSPAIDLAPPEACGVAALTTIALPSADLSRTVSAGDVVRWRNDGAAPLTVALNDGEYNVILAPVPANSESREVQFNDPGPQNYRVFNDDAKEEIGSGTITVQPRDNRPTDQRGAPVPQRGIPMRTDGAGGTYGCDSGAYEFQPWVVGQPLPRPPSAIGTQPPTLNVGGDTNTGNYHVWSPATALDQVLRPSPDDG